MGDCSVCDCVFKTSVICFMFEKIWSFILLFHEATDEFY